MLLGRQEEDDLIVKLRSGLRALPPTYMDDLTVLLKVAEPRLLPDAVGRAAAAVLRTVAQRGLEANLGEGKAEVVLKIYGPGAAEVKRRLFPKQAPGKFAVPSIAMPGGDRRLRAVQSYKH